MLNNNSKGTIPCIYVKIQHYISFKNFLTKVKHFILIFEDIANFDSSGFFNAWLACWSVLFLSVVSFC